MHIPAHVVVVTEAFGDHEEEVARFEVASSDRERWVNRFNDLASNQIKPFTAEVVRQVPEPPTPEELLAGLVRERYRRS